MPTATIEGTDETNDAPRPVVPDLLQKKMTGPEDLAGRLILAYRGPIVDWIGGSTIIVPGMPGEPARFLRLDGARDVLGDQSHANKVRARLNAFVRERGGSLTCYRLPREMERPLYRCYSGDQDIAEWAIKNGLASISQPRATSGQ